MKTLLLILVLAVVSAMAQSIVREYPAAIDTKSKRWVVDYSFVSDSDDRLLLVIQAWGKMTLKQQQQFVINAEEIVKTNKPTDTLVSRWTNSTVTATVEP